MTTTFSAAVRNPGSKQVQWNVDRDGKPFGAIWTFKVPRERHPFHTKPLNGHHRCWYTLAAAKNHMKGVA